MLYRFAMEYRSPILQLVVLLALSVLLLSETYSKNVKAAQANVLTVTTSHRSLRASDQAGFDSSEGKFKNCDGTLGKCLHDNHERELIMMESDEVVPLRRELTEISNGAMRGDQAPCKSPNCNADKGPVRPHRRSCTTITRCKRDTG